MKKILFVVCLVCVLSLPVIAAENQGEKIVGDVCNTCHTYTRICANLGEDKDFWHATVSRMMTNGAPIEAEDIEPTAEYLAGLEPGSEPVCR
ncbi:MAG: hypothetical protein ACOC0U_01695 [Desulfovibrionales bacterium]